MQKEHYISIDLAKWFAERCEVPSGYRWCESPEGNWHLADMYKDRVNFNEIRFPAYSYYQILVTNVEDFFGKEKEDSVYKFRLYTMRILQALQNDERNRAEDFIKEYSMKIFR